MDQMLPEYSEGYELTGVPLHSIKHEHFTMDDYVLSKLTPEEEERRRVRRERNKVAASKCRNKRKEHIRHLMKESEELECKNSNLQNEINTLQSEIKQLESMLDSHRCNMSCKVSN
eukprot:gene20120-22092_t